MSERCPISGDLVDERAARIAALLVVILGSVLSWGTWSWQPRWMISVLAFGLALDFLLRSLALRRFKLIAQTSRLLHALRSEQGSRAS